MEDLLVATLGIFFALLSVTLIVGGNNIFDMKKFNIIEYGIYPFSVLLTVGTTEKEVLTYVEKHIDYSLSENEKSLFDFEGDGRTILLSGGQTVLWLRSFNKKSAVSYGVLNHEIFHAIHFLFEKIKIKLSYDSDEAFTYAIQFLTERILKILL